MSYGEAITQLRNEAALAAGVQPGRELFAAAKMSNAQLVLALLQSGAALTQVEAAMLQPELEQAVAKGQCDLVHALLQAGVRLGSVTERSTGLYHAAKDGSLAAVRCWRAAGAVLSGADVTHAQQGLLWSLSSSHCIHRLECVKRWLAAGVDPSAACDLWGTTALEMAAGLGRKRCLQAMMQAGAALQLGPPAAQSEVLAAALEAGLRGSWLMVLVPQGGIAAAHLQRWAAATLQGKPDGRRWAAASLMALQRQGLPGELAQRVLALALL